jgi:hypothetical protein
MKEDVNWEAHQNAIYKEAGIGDQEFAPEVSAGAQRAPGIHFTRDQCT